MQDERTQGRRWVLSSFEETRSAAAEIANVAQRVLSIYTLDLEPGGGGGTRGADDAEIERLMDELQQALNRFLEALAEQMRDQLAAGAEPQPLPPDTQILPSDELQRMIDQAREMARSGARDAARDMLARLQNMLENLRASPFSPGLDDNGRNAFQMLQDMESLMRDQQELLDRSYQRALKRGPSDENRSSDSQQNSETAQAQDRLRRQLGEMMRRLAETLGEIPRPLGRAEQSMRDARDALQGGRPGDAVPPQTRTMDQLQQGLQSMAEQFMEQMGQAAERNSGQLGVRPGSGQDPLGRRPGSSGIEALEGVEIPDRMELRRAREILDELRRRRGDRDRPTLELDYIYRLLRQFWANAASAWRQICSRVKGFSTTSKMISSRL